MASHYMISKGVDERLAGCRVTVNLDALKKNYHYLQQCAITRKNLCPWSKPMVMALALIWSHLHWQKRGAHVFVAVPHEGVVLRKILPEAEIFILAGVTHFSAPILARERLTPCLGSLEQIEIWHQFWANAASAARSYSCGYRHEPLGLTLEEAIAFAAHTIKKTISSRLYY